MSNECDREVPEGEDMSRNRVDAPQEKEIYIYIGYSRNA